MKTAILVLLSFLTIAQSWANETDRKELDEATYNVLRAKYINCVEALQNSRDQVDDRLEKNQFRTLRNLYKYSANLYGRGIPKLEKKIKSLPPGSIIADAGAGYAIMLQEVLKEHRELFGLALGVEIPEDDPRLLQALKSFMAREPVRFAYIWGKKLEQMMADPLSPIHKYKGQVTLLIDIMGPLAYTYDLDLVLNAYADLLQVGGEVMTQFIEWRTSFWVKVGNKRVRMQLKDMGPYISRITGGRLQLVKGKPNLSINDVPSETESVLYLRKVKNETDPVDVEFKVLNFNDGTPPSRTIEVNDIAPKTSR